MRQLSFHHFSFQKLFLAFVFMHMTPISSPQAADGDHKDIDGNHKDIVSKELKEDPKLTHLNDSSVMSASLLESYSGYGLLSTSDRPLPTWLEESMVPTSSSTSYHWRELEFLWSLISNNIPSHYLPGYSYFSSQPPDDVPPLSDLNGSILSSSSTAPLIDPNDPYFGFHYYEDETDTNT
jgi:hypothetical protein